MRRRVKMVFLFALAAVLASGAAERACAQAPTPAGVWRTFDDKTGLERGLVRIREERGEFVGTIVGTVDPTEGAQTCEFCEGDRRGKPIMGLTILTNLRLDGDTWDGGRILEPETGSIYRCSMRLAEGGRKLIVRGYLGISLFGRTQTWLRAP